LTKCRYPVLKYDSTARALVTTAPPEKGSGDSSSEHSFDSKYFDHVYEGATLRVDLKKELQPIVDCVLEGRSAAVVAYGKVLDPSSLMLVFLYELLLYSRMDCAA
jgi:hypothetical protein